MKVDYERSGGFAGMRMAASFDLDELPEQQAAEIKECLHRAQFHELPERIANQPAMPDQFTYKITVDTGTTTHTVMTGDASAPVELRELIDLLTKLARSRRAS